MATNKQCEKYSKMPDMLFVYIGIINGATIKTQINNDVHGMIFIHTVSTEQIVDLSYNQLTSAIPDF